MRILVSGGAGFVGSHVVDRLVVSGHDVTTLDNLSKGLPLNVNPSSRFIKADIRDPLYHLVAELQPEVIVHLAAQVSVPDSVVDPATDLQINIAGTVNMIEVAARTGVRKVISLSSAAIYGAPEQFPIREDCPEQALSPYGLSKLAGEQYIRLLSGLRGVAFTIIRPANLYGPRQTTEGEGAVIPAFLHGFLTGQDPVIQGDGEQTRDFLYVTDVARAIEKCLHAGDGMTLNISSGIGISVSELWHMLADMLGWKQAPRYGPARVGDIRHSTMCNELACMVLNWAPSVPIVEGLAKTIAWNRLREAAATRE